LLIGEVGWGVGGGWERGFGRIGRDKDGLVDKVVAIKESISNLI